MKILGIDPGQSGCLCTLDSTSPTTPEFLDMPTLTRTITTGKKRQMVDLHQVRDFLEALAESDAVHIVMEEISGFGPALGHSAGSFSFSRDYGALLGLLVAMRLPHTLVLPQRWQKAIGKTSADKAESILLARRLYPLAVLVPPGCRKPSDGRAEALLIAEYGRRQQIGIIKAS